MAKYRAGIIGLGWTGMLYDLGQRPPVRFEIDDIDRPTGELDVHKKFYYHDHAGGEGEVFSYAEALSDRPEVDLVAAAERDTKRLDVFRERYGVTALYTDAEEMLRKESLDIVAIATNTKDRPRMTWLAAENGAKGITTQKPMAHTLEEADRMVKTCADAGVPLNCGPAGNHPSFDKARELLTSGAIGQVQSVETSYPDSQRQHWVQFVDSAPAWVIGTGDQPRRESGSDEFIGQGMVVTQDATVVHFRHGAPHVRITGSEGEMLYARDGEVKWRLWQDIDTPAGRQRVEMPWPDPQYVGRMVHVYPLADIIDTMEGRRDEPKSSGRRVASVLEVEIAMKLSSARGGERVDLPLEDRTLGLHYDWFR